MLLLLIIILAVLFLGGGGNYYAGRTGWYGSPNYGSNLVWIILLIIIFLALFGHFGTRWY